MASPDTPTIKRLFALSGNRCAFSGCTVPIIDRGSGVILGEICHIAGKKPGALRYDPIQSDEQRHDYTNLILMCPTHHKLVDELTEEYTIQRLLDMKSAHESSVMPAELPDEFVDDLLKVSASKAQTLYSMARVLVWDDQARTDALLEINALLPVLLELPRRSREFFTAILRRSRTQFGSTTVLWPEIQNALRLDVRTMKAEVAILEYHGLVTIDIDDREIPMITVSQGQWDWSIWEAVRNYCQVSSISLADVIVNLSFDYLD